MRSTGLKSYCVNPTIDTTLDLSQQIILPGGVSPPVKAEIIKVPATKRQITLFQASEPAFCDFTSFELWY